MKIIRKLKNFIHRHENLEKLALFIWGVFYIIRARFVFKRIKHEQIKKRDPKVLILAVRTIPSTNLVYFDAIFGHAFKKIGCDVKMLYCDGVLDSCDADTVFRNQKPQCFVCKKLGNCLKKSLNLNCISFRQYITDSDIKIIKEKVAKLNINEFKNYKYLGVNVGEHAVSSAIRYFLSGRLDLDNPKQAALLRRKLVNAMIITKISEGVYLKEKPDIIFTLHGIYSTWGPFFEYFCNKNRDVIVYANVPVRFGHFIFNCRSREFEFDAKRTWDEFKKTPLLDNEEFQIDDYLSDRLKGKVGDHLLYNKNFRDISKKQLILKLLFNKKYSRRYVLYSNLAWDSCVMEHSSTIFNNIFKWIDATIDYFIDKKEYQLIIKPHPAELIWEEGRSKGIADYIFNKYPNLPDNITVLKADTPLRAHELITPESNSVCLAFNGFIGLELATQGTPVLVAGVCHYTDAGVIYKVKSIEEYLSLLDNPQKLISFAKSNVKLAKKYAYFSLFRKLIRIPFYRNDKWATIDWKVMAAPQKLLDDNGNIMKICKKIIKGEDVVNPL